MALLNFEWVRRGMGIDGPEVELVGQTVRIKLSAKPEQRPGVLASVCGLREVETEEQARQFGCPVGTTLYLVEYGDGVAVELPSAIVELVEDDEPN